MGFALLEFDLHHRFHAFWIYLEVKWLNLVSNLTASITTVSSKETVSQVEHDHFLFVFCSIVLLVNLVSVCVKCWPLFSSMTSKKAAPNILLLARMDFMLIFLSLYFTFYIGLGHERQERLGRFNCWWLTLFCNWHIPGQMFAWHFYSRGGRRELVILSC